jgi:hypothetical protein
VTDSPASKPRSAKTAKPAAEPAASAAAPAAPAEQTISIDVSVVPGFFRALVDFKFVTFVTRRIAGFIYAILLVSILLAGLVAFFGIVVSGVGLMTGGQLIPGLATVLGGIVLVPVGTLVAVVLARMIVEVNVALVAIAENTARLR